MNKMYLYSSSFLKILIWIKRDGIEVNIVLLKIELGCPGKGNL